VRDRTACADDPIEPERATADLASYTLMSVARLATVLAALAAAGCAIPNPLFGLSGEAGSGGDGREPLDRGDAPGFMMDVRLDAAPGTGDAPPPGTGDAPPQGTGDAPQGMRDVPPQGTSDAPGPGGGDARPADGPPAPRLDAAITIDAPPTLPPGYTGDLNKNLALFLALEDATNTVVLKDSSGGGALAVLKSVDQAGWFNARGGQALALAGASWGGWIEVNGPTAFAALTPKFSVSMWINRTESGGALFSRRATAGYLVELNFQQDTLAVQLNAPPGYHVNLSATGTAPLGRWIQVGVTFDAQVVILYVEGVAVGASTYGMAVALDISPIIVGGLEQTNKTVTTRFTGKIDDVLLYSRALTPEEMSVLALGFRPVAR
jgi:hypothetical protein